MDWVRLYHDMPALSHDGIVLADAIFFVAQQKRTHRPPWREIELKSGLSRKKYLAAFMELEDCGIVSATFPSVIPAIEGYNWSKEWTGRIPWPKWAVVRARIFTRDGHRCTYCGASGVSLECDHVVPISKGGSNKDENLVAACIKCNRSKRDKTPDEWMAA